jgi:hypothetical protein
MSSRKPKQDIECLNYWEAPQLQLVEAVPGKKVATTPRSPWDASSELIVDAGGKVPRSRLH